MTRKTLLMLSILAALSVTVAWAATPAAQDAAPPATQVNADGKLSADERPGHRDGHRHGRRGGRGGHARMQLDTDKDGRISRSEAVTRDGFASRFEEMDHNKDGYLDKTDRELRARQRRDQWFASADGNQDGQLSREEVDTADAKRGQQRRAQWQARADQRFTGADSNRDGKLSREEVKSNPRLEVRFEQLDANKDGALSKDELPARRGHR